MQKATVGASVCSHWSGCVIGISLPRIANIVVAVFAVAISVPRACSADATDALFQIDRVLEIDIQMPVADWDQLRFQHPDVQSVTNGEFTERPYTYFPGVICIDGTTIEQVGIRKKGFIGSATSQNPSLKIDLEEYTKGVEYSGMDHLTLNNNLQDPSCLNQFLVYYLFRKAKVPTPRCNFAVVTINGEAKGIYSHVEPIRKPFLARHFPDNGGNLYEGRKSDVRHDWISTFDKKTNKKKKERDDLRRVADVLEKEGDQFVDAIDELLDLDAFFRFWAMECLVGHWDGYAENLNNFYLYRDPGSGKFYFIPWGADEAFGDSNPFLKYKPPVSVKAVGFLCRKLYNHPPTRKRYRQTLKQLLHEVWDEAELLQLVDDADEMITPHLTRRQQALHGVGIRKIKTFIQKRRSELLADLEKPATDWNFPPETKHGLPLHDFVGTVKASFRAPWRSRPPGLNFFAGSKVELEVKLNGEAPEIVLIGAASHRFPEAMRYGYPSIMVGGFQKKNGRLLCASLIVDPDLFKPGELPVDMFAVMGAMIDVNPLFPDSMKVVGMLSGTLKLEQAAMEDGKMVSGTMDLRIHSN